MTCSLLFGHARPPSGRMILHARRRRRPRLLSVIGLVLWGMAGWGLPGCDRASQHESSPSSVPAESRPGDHASQSDDDRPRIVSFGDSLTAGLGVVPEEAYPAQLQRRLDELGYRYHVINAGVSGDTTAGGLRRVDWVLKSHPAIVILELGANDGLRGLDLQVTRANLEQIISRLQAADVTVLLTGMKLPPNYGADYTKGFEAIYQDLADRSRVAFMPFFLEGVAAQRALNQPDGIHPTARGYRIIVDKLLPVLEPLLIKGPPGKGALENSITHGPQTPQSVSSH